MATGGYQNNSSHRWGDGGPDERGIYVTVVRFVPWPFYAASKMPTVAEMSCIGTVLLVTVINHSYVSTNRTVGFKCAILVLGVVVSES